MKVLFSLVTQLVGKQLEHRRKSKHSLHLDTKVDGSLQLMHLPESLLTKVCWKKQDELSGGRLRQLGQFISKQYEQMSAIPALKQVGQGYSMSLLNIRI